MRILHGPSWAVLHAHPNNDGTPTAPAPATATATIDASGAGKGDGVGSSTQVERQPADAGQPGSVQEWRSAAPADAAPAAAAAACGMTYLGGPGRQWPEEYDLCHT